MTVNYISYNVDSLLNVRYIFTKCPVMTGVRLFVNLCFAISPLYLCVCVCDALGNRRNKEYNNKKMH